MKDWIKYSVDTPVRIIGCVNNHNVATGSVITIKGLSDFSYLKNTGFSYRRIEGGCSFRSCDIEPVNPDDYYQYLKKGDYVVCIDNTSGLNYRKINTVYQITKDSVSRNTIYFGKDLSSFKTKDFRLATYSEIEKCKANNNEPTSLNVEVEDKYKGFVVGDWYTCCCNENLFQFNGFITSEKWGNSAVINPTNKIISNSSPGYTVREQNSSYLVYFSPNNKANMDVVNKFLPKDSEKGVEKDFKVGDWIIYDGSNHKNGPFQLVAISEDGKSGKSCMGYHDLSVLLYRKATQEEINSVNPPEPTPKYSEQFFVKITKEFTQELCDATEKWLVENSRYPEVKHFGKLEECIEEIGKYDRYYCSHNSYHGIDNNTQGIEKELSISELKTLIGYSDKISQYDYEVVHCKTQEEWDFVLKIIDAIKSKNYFVQGKVDCLTIKSKYAGDAGCHCSREWYKENNSLIYSFQEWCDKFNHVNPFIVKEDSLLEEAKRRYPVGTKFWPAHLPERDNAKEFCIVSEKQEFVENGTEVYLLLGESRCNDTDNPEFGNCNYNYILYYKSQWAKIINDEESPKTYEFNKGDLVVVEQDFGGWIENGEIVRLGGEFWRNKEIDSLNKKQRIAAISKKNPEGNAGGITPINFRKATEEEIAFYEKIGIGANIHQMKNPFPTEELKEKLVEIQKSPVIADKTNIKIGTRVVRGKDWSYGDQDVGEGNIGVITDVKDLVAEVSWNNRYRSYTYTYYRIGYDNKFDLYLAPDKVSLFSIYDPRKTYLHTGTSLPMPDGTFQYPYTIKDSIPVTNEASLQQNQHGKPRKMYRIGIDPATETKEKGGRSSLEVDLIND